jgi:hypothetical protein
MSIYNIVVAILFIIVVGSAKCRAADAKSDVVEYICSSLLQLKGLTNNLEIVTRSSMYYSPGIIGGRSNVIGGGTNWGEVISTSIYNYNGHRFRENYTIISSSLKTPNVTNYQVAYDGNTLWTYRGDVQQLVYTRRNIRPNPYKGPDLMTLQYLFLAQDSDACLACFPAVVDLLDLGGEPNRIADLLVNVNPNDIDFKSGTVQKQTTYWKVDWNVVTNGVVFFEPRYLTRSMQNLGRKTYDIISYTNLSWTGFPLAIPAVYDISSVADPDRLIITGHVELVSVKTNIVKSDTFYTLADLVPRSIYNHDLQQLDKRDTQRPSVDPAIMSRYRLIRAVICTMFVLISSVFIYVLVIRKMF